MHGWGHSEPQPITSQTIETDLSVNKHSWAISFEEIVMSKSCVRLLALSCAAHTRQLRQVQGALFLESGRYPRSTVKGQHTTEKKRLNSLRTC